MLSTAFQRPHLLPHRHHHLPHRLLSPVTNRRNVPTLPATPLSRPASRRRAIATMRSSTPPGNDDATDGNDKNNMDIIERAYTFFFGAKQSEPFGLKRFDRDRFPELYPAPLDEFADPVPSDTPEVALFRPLLARTQLQHRAIQLRYDANQSGWTSDAFHAAVDRLGAAVVLARTVKGALVGGYNPKGFVGYGESRGSKAAFVFCWPDGDTGKPPLKMRKVGGAALAVMDEPDAGPKFGADALVVPLRPPRAEWERDGERDRLAMSKLGSYYERRPDGSNTLFADGESGKGTTLLELKVFTGVYEEGEEIPFNDALPFSLE